ncbi:hypothetical protein K474DRAFT_1303131 [Panus rudis PR-1116 ss-1]|nr:hypothetical protein K474DRAFT_1303131 [Panus rudis PR-1116 ss-1]
MRLSASSSFILATIASSGSLSAMAAPAEPSDQLMGTSSLSSIAQPLLGGPQSTAQPGTHENSARDLSPTVDSVLDPIKGIIPEGPLRDIIQHGQDLVDGVLKGLPLPLRRSNVARGTEQAYQVEGPVSDALGIPLPGSLHDARADLPNDEKPACPSTVSACPTSSSYPTPYYSSTPSSDVAAEAAPTPPSGVPSLPVSPPLPSPPPNSPAPPADASQSGSKNGTSTSGTAPTNGQPPLFSPFAAMAAEAYQYDTTPSSNSTASSAAPAESTGATSSKSSPSSTGDSTFISTAPSSGATPANSSGSDAPLAATTDTASNGPSSSMVTSSALPTATTSTSSSSSTFSTSALPTSSAK